MTRGRRIGRLEAQTVARLVHRPVDSWEPGDWRLYLAFADRVLPLMSDDKLETLCDRLAEGTPEVGATSDMMVAPRDLRVMTLDELELYVRVLQEAAEGHASAELLAFLLEPDDDVFLSQLRTLKAARAD